MNEAKIPTFITSIQIAVEFLASAMRQKKKKKKKKKKKSMKKVSYTL